MGSNPAAVKETEADLVSRAQLALSHCNWEVGECAATWTTRFARGRTDGDFGAQIGLSADQVYQRRRVWETFADVRDNYSQLKWSHFYAALTWDDAAECLQWAEEIRATVAEMKAWRRAQRGEDLSTAGAEEPISILLGEPVAVKAPFDGPTASGSPRAEGTRNETEVDETPALAGVARQSEGGGEYAPFREGAAVPPSANGPAGERTPLTPEQTIKRMTSAIERCQAMLTAEVRTAFPKLPEKVRQRFLRALKDLQQAAHDLT